MSRGIAGGGRAAAVVAALAGALAGCASTNCDPSQAGFLDGIGCARNGAYQQRESALQYGAAQAQANALTQQAAAAQAHTDALSAQQDLAARRRQMARLDGRLNDLQHQLRAARARQGADQVVVQRAESDYSALAQLQAAARADPTADELQAIDQRQSKLLKLLNDML